MTQAQYIALCVIGGVAVVAFLESQRVARVLAGIMQGASAQISAPAQV